MEVVLITGGTGLVGQQLSELLTQQNYKVIHVSRKENLTATYPAYKWDLNKAYIDERAIKQADYIVHLAGAGVADKRWTDARKQVILDSRIQSANLLYQSLQKNKHQVKALIGASATGFYGDSQEKLMKEEDAPVQVDFLSEVCQKWEQATQKIEELGIRTAIIRIGLVLTREGGVLAKMALPVKFGIAPYFGNGQQYYSWIHVTDLCRIFLTSIQQDSRSGIYNAVAPQVVTNKEMVKQITKTLRRPFIGIPVPEIALKIGLGELSSALLTGNWVSANKILQTGFTFQYPKLEQALANLLA